MPGSNADVGIPGGLVRPISGTLPRGFRRSVHGTVISPSSMPSLLHGILRSRPVVRTGRSVWTGYRKWLERLARSVLFCRTRRIVEGPA